MFKNRPYGENSNFWISYADLMAGLLFVFILLIGAIVSKSILLRQNLNKKELALKEKQETVKNLNNQVKEQIKKIKLQEDEIYKLKTLLQDRAIEFNKTKKVLALTKKELELKDDELKRLNQILLVKNTKLDKLNGKIILLQNILKDTNTTLQDKKQKLQEYKDKVLVLSNSLTKKEDELDLKNKKLLELLDALNEKKSAYEDLIKKLQEQRAKIKYLTGIKLRVIDELKKSLGNKVQIDKDGALKLSSKILFDKDSAKLKESAKEQLKSTFTKYINALLGDEAIAPNIETIVIEGHTDSDGGYLYNLKLSQDRALAVMNYLLTLPVAKKYNLQKILTASGRSFIDRIMVNGKEDKEASRRIEIKFRLKNQNAFYEIQKVLDENGTF